jgi:hypothetical protein
MGEQRERLLLTEYVKARYIQHKVTFNCPLGPVPDSLIFEYGAGKAYKVARSMRPEVDALVYDDGTLILIEAKIVRWVDGISKLPLYKLLLATTPEVQPYLSWRVEMELVIPFKQPTMVSVAHSIGVKIVEFSVPEIDKYVSETLPYYQTAEYRQKRKDLVATRKSLGLD